MNEISGNVNLHIGDSWGSASVFMCDDLFALKHLYFGDL